MFSNNHPQLPSAQALSPARCSSLDGCRSQFSARKSKSFFGSLNSLGSFLRQPCWEFPGGPAVKNLPCNAGDAGLIPGQGGWTVKRLPTMQEARVQSLGWEDLLEKERATHSSDFAWRIPWIQEPGGLQSTGLKSQT